MAAAFVPGIEVEAVPGPEFDLAEVGAEGLADPGDLGALAVITRQPSEPAEPGFALLAAVVERVLDAADSSGH